MCKIENANNDLKDEVMESLSKMKKGLIQEQKTKFQENQALHETTKEVKVFKARKKEVGGTQRFILARRLKT